MPLKQWHNNCRQRPAGPTEKVRYNEMRANKNRRIGPVPVAVPNHQHKPLVRIEDDEEPFKVDRNNPGQQALAKSVGWKRLYEIEQEEHAAQEKAKLL